MALEMELVTKVEPGSVTTNFEDFKEALKKEMETKYKSMAVTEESLVEARKARAVLNKAKEGLKDAVRSMKTQNAEPLKIAENQAKELEALIDDAINTLDLQIKGIEEGQKKERTESAIKVLAQKLERLPMDINEFAAGCMDWLINPKWANATCRFIEINKDCDEKVERIQNAWNLLQGKYRPQMLAKFQKDGDLAKAQLYGIELSKQEEMFSLPQKESIPNSEIKLVYDEQVPEAPETQKGILIEAPEAYDNKENSHNKCKAVFKLVCMRYQMEWFLATCERFGIVLERQDK